VSRYFSSHKRTALPQGRKRARVNQKASKLKAISATDSSYMKDISAAEIERRYQAAMAEIKWRRLREQVA
jgi:hypothetical protein